LGGAKTKLCRFMLPKQLCMQTRQDKINGFRNWSFFLQVQNSIKENCTGGTQGHNNYTETQEGMLGNLRENWSITLAKTQGSLHE
jgi:hypothetical protein